MRGNNPIEYLEDRRGEIVNTYNELHKLAEPSWQEEKTSAYLRERIAQAGLVIRQFEGHFGFTAEIPGETEEVVALRADMDALVQEVDGVVKANHSCGHDGHSTMVLYSALAVATSKIRPHKTLRFIFQPAEEKVGGALRMMKDGALENVKILFGTHVRPVMELSYGQASSAIMHGASTSIHGEITGLQAHGSRPQNGKNVIETAGSLIQALQGVRLQAGCAFSVKMTQLQAGGDTSNVIPDKATFKLDMRAQTNEGMTELKQKTEHVINNVAALMDTPIAYQYGGFVPAATLNEEAMKLLYSAISKVLGEENAREVCVSPGGEDFHFYSLNTPGLAATMLGLGCDLQPGLHHPQMSFNPEALVYGTQILTTALLDAAKPDHTRS